MLRHRADQRLDHIGAARLAQVEADLTYHLRIAQGLQTQRFTAGPRALRGQLPGGQQVKVVRHITLAHQQLARAQRHPVQARQKAVSRHRIGQQLGQQRPQCEFGRASCRERV